MSTAPSSSGGGPSSSGGALVVRMYVKDGCHLCEQAEVDLAALRGRYPHTLELVDIARDAELVQRYGERIPVLVVQGTEHAAPLTRGQIERALRATGTETHRHAG